MSASPQPHRLLQFALGATAAFSVVSALPFLAERLGVRFLPDPQVFSGWGTVLAALAVGLALGVLALLLAAPARGIVFRALRLVAPLVYAGLFYVGLTTAVPMVWTTVAGKPSVMVVTVAFPRGTPTSRCRPAVQLDSLPVLFDRLCGVPVDLVMTLNPGDKVMLFGKRSRLGMFYSGARLLPRGEDA